MRVPNAASLGGRSDFPVDGVIFRPERVLADIVAGRRDAAIRELAEAGAEILLGAQRGQFDCALCHRPFREPPALLGWLATTGGSRRAAFAVCQDCDGEPAARSDQIVTKAAQKQLARFPPL
jgi:hypothetical protein